MRDQHIAGIRAACIKANPEIEAEWPCECRKCGVPGKHQFRGRSIRLADVLLAIENTGVHCAFYGEGNLWLVKPTMEGLGTGRENCTYDLRQDDLTLQSDETISWLYDLLK
jgi:hypothetical protein